MIGDRTQSGPKSEVSAKAEGATGRSVRAEKKNGLTELSIDFGLVRQVIETVWLPKGLSEEERKNRISGAMQKLLLLTPQDPAEGLLTAQMVGCHNAAMECLRRSMLPDLSQKSRDLELKTAQKLLTLYARQLEALDKHRGKGQQKVTVEYVNVESGGQAIVGAVETSAGKRRQESKTSAVEHAPETPFEPPGPRPAPARAKTAKTAKRGR